MSGFYIKKVIAKSAVKGDASVTFGKGLTIIQGRSDSGKTCVANCIDFIFGGSVDKPFKETAKYDGVSMIVASNDNEGKVTLHRTVGKNQVEVSSNIEGIASGTYDVNYRKGAKNPPLNEVWLKLIGIEQETMIVANARFEKKRLTWRNLLRVFYLDENRVDDIDSIVEPKHRYMENTLFLSALLFLITGRTFTETDAQETIAAETIQETTDALILIAMIVNRTTISSSFRFFSSPSRILLHSFKYANSIRISVINIPRFVIDMPYKNACKMIASKGVKVYTRSETNVVFLIAFRYRMHIMLQTRMQIRLIAA